MTPAQRSLHAAGHEIAQEFPDDGVTGKLHMHQRPQGKLLIAALLGDGVKTVLCYDAKRIGRTQPAYWSFIGLCRDNGISVLDANGTNLCESSWEESTGCLPRWTGTLLLRVCKQARSSGAV